jgi:hypothetical protein
MESTNSAANRPFLLNIGLIENEQNCVTLTYDDNNLEQIAQRILYTYRNRNKKIPDCINDISHTVWGKFILPDLILINYASIIDMHNYKRICYFNEIKTNIDFFNFVCLCMSHNKKLCQYIVKKSKIDLLNSARLDGHSLLHASLLLNDTKRKICHLEILLKLGANINFVNNDFKTPLEIALEDNASLPTLQFLILSGAVVSNSVSSTVQKRYDLAMQDLFKKAIVCNLVIDEFPNDLKKIIVCHLFTPIWKNDSVYLDQNSIQLKILIKQKS